jgi:hypothetical protein|tara:strand:+ start:1040 stop:1315 length:276 start_codon:yes stop_codon:yes gene_type:complete
VNTRSRRARVLTIENQSTGRTPMKFSIMFWQKPGLAWVKLNDDEQWRLVARADFDPENYHELSRLTGLLRKGNYEKKDLDSALKFIYSNFS